MWQKRVVLMGHSSRQAEEESEVGTWAMEERCWCVDACVVCVVWNLLDGSSNAVGWWFGIDSGARRAVREVEVEVERVR